MAERLEKRWRSWEQPLLLLSFCLHPKYRFIYFSNHYLNLSRQLSSWLLYYYEAWFKEKPRKVLLELEDYNQKNFPFDDQAYEQFGNDILKFWCFCERNGGEQLAKVACRIFGICVNSASVERLWSSMGYLHSKRRNRLGVRILSLLWYIILV